AENLQGISTEIQDGLEFDIKFAISSASKHTARACEHPLNPDSQFTRLGAEAKSSKGLRPWLLRPAFSRPPACCRYLATASMTRSRSAATRPVKFSSTAARSPSRAARRRAPTPR